MRLMIAAAGLLLTASMAFAGEVASTTLVAPQAAVATTGQSSAEGAALSTSPYKAKSKSGYSGCHGSREAQAPLLMY